MDAAGGGGEWHKSTLGAHSPAVDHHGAFGWRASRPANVRIMDAAVYMRPCQGGFLWGVYGETPRFFDMESLGTTFDIKDMPLDIEVLLSAAAEVREQLPILQTPKVGELRGGIPTMTADVHHIL